MCVCVCEHILNSGESRTLGKEEGLLEKGAQHVFPPKFICKNYNVLRSLKGGPGHPGSTPAELSLHCMCAM